ncbi:MAG: SDR family oxidoreductase [Leptolyngbya sp. SIO4C1]|nr:SDR family oxidoreductase [Leptolyngbya sp. SIO4C1]
MTEATRKRALVTGASTGIGRATAIAFAKAGFDLALVSRSEAKLAAIAEQLSEVSQVDIFPIDLAALAEVKPAIGRILQHGPLDVVVNNAGMGYTGSLMDTSLADWQQVIDLNLTSVFQCLQAVLPAMCDRGSGLIINVASIAARQAFPDWGAYSVSKAGLLALSRAAAVEALPRGVRVTTVLPGAVNTPLWDTDTVQADFDRAGMLTPETVAQSILHTALLPESAVIEELTLMPSGGAL